MKEYRVDVVLTIGASLSLFLFQATLQESLYEMNRRLRRRMVTRGEISLDVEDNLGPYDWPQLSDVTIDRLKHSVHFPLISTVSFCV